MDDGAEDGETTDEFDFVVDVQLRLRDIDEMGHVNNAVYLTYLEIARDRYVAEIVGETLIELGAALVNLEIDYVDAIEEGDDVTVAVRAEELGRTSLRMAYEVRANGEPAAHASTTLVAYDREADEAKPLPDYWRDPIEAHEGL